MNTVTAPSLVSDALKQQYHEEGYIILERVIPADMLQMLREECSYFLGYHDAEMDMRGVQTDGLNHRSKRYFISNHYHLSSRMWQFIYGPLMAEVVRATLGPDAFLFHEQWVIKGAEQGMKFAWHQDSGYVGRQNAHKPYLTCWCTLDDVNEENGTVYVLPHSRGGTKETVFEHVKETGSNDMIGYQGSDPGIPIVAPAGSIVAFTSYTFHRSGANTTERMRRIYLPQYSCEPIRNKEGGLWAMAVPFMKDGQIVYDRTQDTFERNAAPHVKQRRMEMKKG